jgi:beta-ureidopropionase
MAARVLGLQGAHLLLVPTATYREWIREVWEIELRAQAIANMSYVGGVNKVGRDIGGPADRHYFGSALFVDPGEPCCAAQATARTRSSTRTSTRRRATRCGSSGGFLKFRRPDAYGLVVEGAAQVDTSPVRASR